MTFYQLLPWILLAVALVANILYIHITEKEDAPTPTPTTRKEVYKQIGIPDHVQIWPLGTGVIAMTRGLGPLNKMLFFAAKPDNIDEMIEHYGDDHAALMTALMRNSNGQSMVMSFTNKNSIDNLIDLLEEIREELPDE